MAANQTSPNMVKAGGAFVELSATDEALQRGLLAAKNRLKKFGVDVGAMGAILTKLGSSIVAPLALATNQYASLSDKMLVVRARTKASDDEFASMKKRVTELTQTTSFSATEIAEGMINLASMGMNPQQINAMIGSLLNLSRATGEELGNAVTIALNNMNIFKADIDETERYVDILSKTANGSAQVLGDLGEALKMSAGSAKTAKIDFLTLNAILAILANNGQRGTMAGTGLRNIFLSFTKNADKFKEYKINITEANGELRKIPAIFADIAKKIENMPTMEKQQMFSELFGTRGLNAAFVLTENVKALQDFTSELKKAEGDGAKTAQLMDSEIGGAFRGVGNSFKGLTGSIGEAIANYIIPFLDKTRIVLNNTTDWVKRNNDIIVTIGKVGVGLIAAGVSLLALSKLFAVASAVVGGFAVACHAVLGALILLANPFNASIALMGVLAAAAVSSSDEFKNSFSAAFDDVKSGYQDLKLAILNGKLEDAFAVIVLSIKSIWHDLFDEIIGYWKAVESFFAKGFAWIYSKFDSSLDFKEMTKSIDDMISNDVESFKSAREKYQREIADIVEGIKTNKAEKAANAETSTSTLGHTNINDLLGKIPKIETDLKSNRFIDNPTFGGYNLDAINLGAPQFQVEEKMLNELKKIEKNTRDMIDNDDGAIELY